MKKIVYSSTPEQLITAYREAYAHGVSLSAAIIFLKHVDRKTIVDTYEYLNGHRDIETAADRSLYTWLRYMLHTSAPVAQSVE